MVYDITKSDTFGRAKEWVKELQRQASPNIVIALAGNKADLAGKNASISVDNINERHKVLVLSLS